MTSMTVSHLCFHQINYYEVISSTSYYFYFNFDTSFNLIDTVDFIYTVVDFSDSITTSDVYDSTVYLIIVKVINSRLHLISF